MAACQELPKDHSPAMASTGWCGTCAHNAPQQPQRPCHANDRHVMPCTTVHLHAALRYYGNACIEAAHLASRSCSARSASQVCFDATAQAQQRRTDSMHMHKAYSIDHMSHGASLYCVPNRARSKHAAAARAPCSAQHPAWLPGRLQTTCSCRHALPAPRQHACCDIIWTCVLSHWHCGKDWQMTLQSAPTINSDHTHSPPS